ncbi:PREDICTED: UV radiation resistance associated protein-like isoform X2 [Nelumbo nucifera]|nr:PREDICTED: UV radiation resistance associated protein-like isoform X2 [Nelumbo nucifera]
MLDKMRARKLVMGKMLMYSKVVSEDVRNQEEELKIELGSLLVAAKSLCVASKQLQEENRLLVGQRGHSQLKNLLKLLVKRQQYMISQVSTLYPVKPSAESTCAVKLDSSSNGTKLGNSSKPLDPRSLTILGLEHTSHSLKMMKFFSKEEVKKSASSLGYVAHAVSLIASYLDVRLRYPLRFGGSYSCIIDNAPSIDPVSDSTPNLLPSADYKPTEFPLFLEGQDTTRAAYAIFLLNKDLEQLLNFVGVKSLGPRHILANLNELLRTIQSLEI